MVSGAATDIDRARLQACGTNDGRLALYRETIALQTIDLADIHGQLLADAQRTAVVRMHATEHGLLVCTQIGAVFVFPPLDPDDEDKNSRWRKSKAVVVSSR